MELTMTYNESAALMTNMEFRGRVKVAALKYADSIINEPNTTPAHNTRLRWASSCEQNPDMTASQLQPPTVMDPAVQVAGPEISDTGLQGAVETVVNKML
jgi:hypothetical protein